MRDKFLSQVDGIENCAIYWRICGGGALNATFLGMGNIFLLTLSGGGENARGEGLHFSA